MSADVINVDVQPQLFEGGPPLRLQRSIGLVAPGRLHVGRRALLAALISWVPMALLVLADSIFFSRPIPRAFFTGPLTRSAQELLDPEILTEPDFSATTDYYSVAANVYEMRDMPFSLKDLMALLCRL